MADFNWHSFLRDWNGELIADPDIASQLPPAIKASGWLGFPGATPQQIAQAETRIGKPLPPSYRAFLAVTNGWRHPGFFVDLMWPTDEIEWFRVHNYDWITDWAAGEMALKGAKPPPPDSDTHYLPFTLQISDVGDSAVFLLNPQTVRADGEWEAWFFSNWNPGANRYASFQEMMVKERQNFLYVRDHRQ